MGEQLKKHLAYNQQSNGGCFISGKKLNSSITGVDSKFTTFSTNTTSALNSKAHVFTITNIDSGAYSEGDFHIGRAIINNVAYLNLEVGWIILQFEIRNNSIKIREKFGNSAWCSWKALVP